MNDLIPRLRHWLQTNLVFRLINFFYAKVINLIAWSKKIVLPGFDGIPLYDVAVFFGNGLWEGQLTSRASAIAYNFFVALFPTIIFFFTIIPFIPVDHFQEMLLGVMEEFVPTQAYSAVEGTIIDIVTRPRGGLLSIGFVLAMYFSTNGIASLAEGFNSSVHITETRSWFQQRLVCLLLVIILSLLIILSLALISLGNFTFGFLSRHGILSDRLIYYMLQGVRWFILIALVFFGNSFLYYFAPTRRNRFRFFSAGSTLSTILILAITMAFNYYVNNFSSYNALYGSIGTLLIVLLWIYFNSIILLIGFELNASIGIARRNNLTSLPEASDKLRIKENSAK